MLPIIGPLFTLLTHGVDAYKQVKKQGVEQVISKQAAVHDLALAKLGAEQRRFEKQHQADSDYDTRVLENRRFSVMDEILISVWLGVFVSHFIPWMQPFMKAGWSAMGYTSGPPWWFEFGMVGILISTLGLMALFRVWRGDKSGSTRKAGQ